MLIFKVRRPSCKQGSKILRDWQMKWATCEMTLRIQFTRIEFKTWMCRPTIRHPATVDKSLLLLVASSASLFSWCAHVSFFALWWEEIKHHMIHRTLRWTCQRCQMPSSWNHQSSAVQVTKTIQCNQFSQRTQITHQINMTNKPTHQIFWITTKKNPIKWVIKGKILDHLWDIHVTSHKKSIITNDDSLATKIGIK